jgi:hypothetical protein
MKSIDSSKDWNHWSTLALPPNGGNRVEKAVDRVMHAYGLMVSLTPQSEITIRGRVEEHLAGISGTENELAIEGLRFLRREAPPPLESSAKPNSL